MSVTETIIFHVGMLYLIEVDEQGIHLLFVSLRC
jgi:hypothetical protein